MPNEQVTGLVQGLVNEYSWILISFIVVFVLFAFKGAISNLYEGMMFWWGSEFNKDDFVLYNGEKARIKIIGFRNTEFYMIKSGLILPVRNERIKNQDIRIFPKQDPWAIKEVLEWFNGDDGPMKNLPKSKKE